MKKFLALLGILLIACATNELGLQGAPTTSPQTVATRAIFATLPFPEIVGDGNLALPEHEAELLVVEATREFLADSTLREQVQHELAILRASFLEVAGIQARVQWVPNELYVGFDKDTLPNVENGTYHEWDELNQRFSVTKIENGKLTWNRVVNLARIAEEYKRLKGVTNALTNGFVGDGSDVCLVIHEKSHAYIFDRADGDCPSGCIEHTYFGFEINSTLQPRSLGKWIYARGAAEPAWMNQFGPCKQYL